MGTPGWLVGGEARGVVDPGPASPEMPNVQPRHGEVPGSTQHEDAVRRVHFAVGLWTVCPSRRDGYGNIAGKLTNFLKMYIFTYFFRNFSSPKRNFTHSFFFSFTQFGGSVFNLVKQQFKKFIMKEGRY